MKKIQNNINQNKMRTLLTVAIALISVSTFAQKKPNINKAKSAMDKGELAEAKTIIEQAILHEKTKDDAKTWYYRGMIYATLDTALNEPGALEIAMNSFNKSLEIDPEQKSTSSFTGVGIENVDSKVLGYFNHYYNMALTNYNNKEYNEAMINFETSFAINPTDTSAILNAGYAASAADNSEKAEENYRKAIEAGVKDKTIFLQLYNYAVKADDLEKALEAINMGKEIYPNDSELSKYEINLLIKLDKIDDAKAGLEESIANDPSNPDLLFTLGVLKDQLKDPEGAMAAYKKALEIDPNHYNANFNLGVTIFNESNELIKQRNSLGYKETKKYDELTVKINEKLKAALPVWELLYASDSTDLTVLETLSYIYTNLNMKDKRDKIEKELEALNG